MTPAFLRKASIRAKIRLIVMATSAAALLLAGLAFVAADYRSQLRAAQRQLDVLSRIVAAQSSAAVAFGDARAADEILSTLRADEEIVAAAVYDAEGRLFVALRTPGALQAVIPPRAPEEGMRFDDSEFVVTRPIRTAEAHVGTFFVRSDFRNVRRRLTMNLALVALVLAGALAFAYVLASRLEAPVTRPLLHLEETVRRITQERDYSVRAVRESQDELGSLIDGFNEMLRQIQLRDDALRQAHDELEGHVRERTAALEEALRELESFSYTISHDLRAPLRAMAGFSQMILEDSGERLGEPAGEYLRRIAQAAARMDTLIQDLLAYSRVTRQQAELMGVSLDPLVREILRQMEEEIRERGAEVRVESPLPSVRGSPLLLTQALTNLVSNALKFMAPGVAPRVRVGAQRRDGRVRIWVEDNGIGIAPEHRDRIFRMFERLHPQETYPGTGIGLAIVRKAAERMGGTAGLESEPGRGSTFWIELPSAT